MKKLLTIFLATSLLLACNAGSEKEKTTIKEPAIENHNDHAVSTGLALNNGVKWKADANTVVNVDFMQKIMSGAKKESMEDFSQTASSLQDGLNKMVSECKMKGADHDALHLWLEPLMEKTKELKNANSVETASSISGEIEKQINLFAQYFEQ